MAIASGARTRILYIAEVIRGVTPTTPTMKVLRSTSRNINLAKNTLRSQEIREDRQIADERHGFNRVEGSIGAELAVGAYDDMLEGLLASAWVAGATTAGTPDMGATAPSTFTRAAGSWITDGFKNGDIIRTTGFTAAADNGLFRVTNVAATALTVAEATLVTEVSGPGQTLVVQGKKLSIGTTLTTFSFERQFLDISQFQLFKGVTLLNGSISVRPEQMATINFGLLGMSSLGFAGSTAASVVTPAATNAPFSAFDGTLYEGETELAVVTGIDINVDNGRVLEAVVGSEFSPDVFEGTAEISGNMSLLFQDTTHYNKFLNETMSSLWLRLDDLNGTDFMSLNLPKLTYTGGGIDPPREGPFPISMPFTALVDAADTLTSLTIQRSNV